MQEPKSYKKKYYAKNKKSILAKARFNYYKNKLLKYNINVDK